VTIEYFDINAEFVLRFAFGPYPIIDVVVLYVVFNVLHIYNMLSFFSNAYL